jgi:hypothetical protein
VGDKCQQEMRVIRAGGKQSTWRGGGVVRGKGRGGGRVQVNKEEPGWRRARTQKPPTRTPPPVKGRRSRGFDMDPVSYI